MRPASSRPLILIPARMASTRLPGKPLADIAGVPMIVQVYRRAREAGLGPVAVACAESEIAAAVEAAGGKAVLTDPNHPSGSDRIFEALTKMDGDYDCVINVQGDLPTVAPATIAAVYNLLKNSEVDISTAVAPIVHEEDRTNPAIVKAVLEVKPGAASGRALYFSRTPVPHGAGVLWHHIGLYGYRREALAAFVKLPPAELEKREKLEQLRALANGMRIDAAIVDEVPLGVDTPAELALARERLGQGRAP
jgi:3-deoxy-manno-octulosonate cytidylyltransferase (CMP-KDO synthetase)